ncbi:MAG TPA: hypothetical protein PKV12_03005 [Candidatus Syntrophosphaera sp.]|jgi:hypothetical protein|nr:hypothetical protein [Candidatus Syntrophosphaera sp.]
MPDKANDKTKVANKPASAMKSNANLEMKEGHSIGIVELLIFIILAGVIFIFIFGMKQMQEEKEKELLAEKKFEQVLPNFTLISNLAKEYQKNDPFASWPSMIEEIIDPAKVNTPEFKFTFQENGTVIMTTTKEFGKEGIKVTYDIAKNTYDIEDPNPEVKPTIKEDWIYQ